MNYATAINCIVITVGLYYILAFYCEFLYIVIGVASRFSSGFLRLANGYAPSAGRVEIWYSDQWTQYVMMAGVLLMQKLHAASLGMKEQHWPIRELILANDQEEFY